MKTKIKTIHEEGLPNSDRNIGMLINYSTSLDWFESYPYLYNNMNYIFFETIDSLNMYLFYNTSTIKRAYLEESVFDELYDNGLDGKFNSVLEWMGDD